MNFLAKNGRKIMRASGLASFEKNFQNYSLKQIQPQNIAMLSKEYTDSINNARKRRNINAERHFKLITIVWIFRK